MRLEEEKNTDKKKKDKMNTLRVRAVNSKHLPELAESVNLYGITSYNNKNI